MNCQFKAIQRGFITRNQMLDTELRTTGIMPVLRGTGSLAITGAARPEPYGSGPPDGDRVRSFLASLRHEARLPTTFGLYGFLFTCLALESLVLFLKY